MRAMTAASVQAMEEGPIQTQARRLLRAVEGVHLQQLAARSPIGPGALKIGLEKHRLEAIGALEQKSWVAEISTRPKHLYVGVKTPFLASWVVRGYVDRLTPFPVTAPWPGDDFKPGDEDIAVFRRSAVGAALSRLVGRAETGGFSVEGVDVRHGALRMRRGGQVLLQDLWEELEVALARLGVKPTSEHVFAALTLGLLERQRNKRVILDQAWVARTATSLRDVLEALEPGYGASLRSSRERQVRLLALALNDLQRNVASASQRMDPAYVNRSLLALTRCRRTAGNLHEAPLEETARRAIGFCLSKLCGGAIQMAPERTANAR